MTQLTIKKIDKNIKILYEGDSLKNLLENGIRRKEFIIASLCTWGGGAIFSLLYFYFLWMKPNYRSLKIILRARHLTDKMAFNWAFGPGLYENNEKAYSIAITLVATLTVVFILCFIIYQVFCYLRIKNMESGNTISKKVFLGELGFRVFTFFVSKKVFMIYMLCSFAYLASVDKRKIMIEERSELEG